jgi:hypothetical protein
MQRVYHAQQRGAQFICGEEKVDAFPARNKGRAVRESGKCNPRHTQLNKRQQQHFNM